MKKFLCNLQEFEVFISYLNYNIYLIWAIFCLIKMQEAFLYFSSLDIEKIHVSSMERNKSQNSSPSESDVSQHASQKLRRLNGVATILPVESDSKLQTLSSRQGMATIVMKTGIASSSIVFTQQTNPEKTG